MQHETRGLPELPNYAISRAGVLVNVKTGKAVKPSREHYPREHYPREHYPHEHYPRVRLYRTIGGVRTNSAVSIHRAVAAAWVRNPDPIGYDVVNHKDGDTGNYNADNLEWTNPAGNLLHARQTGIRTGGASTANPSPRERHTAAAELCSALRRRLTISSEALSEPCELSLGQGATIWGLRGSGWTRSV
jgi:hypothetical protein